MKRKYTIIVSLFIYCLIFVSSAFCASISDGKPVTLLAKDNDIRDLLTGIAKANDVNLVMSNNVQGRITINISDIPFFKAIELIAKSNGFAVERFDNTVVIARPDEIRGFIPKSIKTFTLQYVSANEIKQSLSGMSIENTEILADQRTNTLIVSGTDGNIQKVEGLIKLLDVPVPEKATIDTQTKLFMLKYARASALQQALASFLSPLAKTIVDDRTNSIIITDQSSNIAKATEIIGQLDIKTAEDIKKEEEAQKPAPVQPPLVTQVFTLNHVEASAIQPVIQSLLTTNGKVQVFNKRKDIVVVEARDTGTAGKDSSLGSSSGMANFYKEKWSDTLIVTDVADVLESVSSLIAELDTKAIQIRIEAKIVEVNNDKGRELGINWSAVHSPSGSYIDGVFPKTISRELDVNIGTLSTDYFENIILKLQAMESSGHAKLLSNPSIVSMDNELAQVLVADKIPVMRTYETEFRSTTGFEFISIGVMLNVVPHITEDGYIIMDTMPIVDSIKQWTGADNNQPIISSRVSHCRVRVKDGETIAIGGLMKEENYDKSEHVPFLGKIPVIGKLFGYNNKTGTKTDLMIFITPKIIKEAS